MTPRPSAAGSGLRLVLLQTQAENAGAQEVSRLLGRALAARGHEIHPLFLFRRTGGFDAEPNVVYCAESRPSNPVALARLLWSLFATLRRLRPDAVLCFQHFGNLIGGPIARLAGVPVVVANQNSASLTTPPWVRRVDRRLGSLGLFDRVVVNSRDSEAEFAGHPDAYRRRLTRIDHGFQGKASTLGRNEARRRFGLPPDGVLLGCVARLHPLKHLDAAVRLLPGEPGWHLAVAGEGGERAGLERLAATLGCADRLHLPGEIPSPEVGDFLAALDVFVFPSQAETFGLAAVEAAQAGVPVVANGLPVLREVLAVDGEPCAVFVDVDDQEAFAEAVRRLLREPDLARKLSARGRRLAERYPLDAMVEGYDALLRAILAARRAPGAGA